MKKLLIFLVIILYSLSCSNKIFGQEKDTEIIDFQQEYRYILNYHDIGEAKTIQKLDYYIAIEPYSIRIFHELFKITRDRDNNIFDKGEIIEKLPYIKTFMNSLNIEVYFRNTSQEMVKSGELDLSKFILFSSKSEVSNEINLNGYRLIFQVTVFMNDTYEYLPTSNLEIYAKFNARIESNDNIHFETDFNNIDDSIKLSDTESANYKYCYADGSSKKHSYSKITPYNDYSHSNQHKFTSTYPITVIKYEMIENYPHKPEIIQPENDVLINKNYVKLKWQRNNFTDYFDVYLHKDIEKVEKLDKDAQITKKLNSDSFTAKNLENGAIHYWLVVAKNKNNNYQSKSEINQFLVDSNTTGNHKEDAIEILSLSQLESISSKPGFWDKNFILATDIDASATKQWNNEQGFSPIGNEKHRFTGTFDGNNHTISNLHINRPKGSNIGLFGFLESAEIKDLKVNNASIRGLNNIGVLVGVSNNSSKIINCHTSGEILCDYYYGYNRQNYDEFKKNPKKEIVASRCSGGLVGVNINTSLITNCSSSAMVEGNQSVGGLVGENTLGSKVIECYARGDVYGFNSVGGLVAQNIKKTSLFTDYIERTAEELFYRKRVQDTLRTEIIECYSSGDVTGVIDYTCHASLLTSSYHTSFGSFDTSTFAIGGLVGLGDSYIIDSYTSSNVIGNRQVGILLGHFYKTNLMFATKEPKQNHDRHKVINSFYNQDKTLLNGEKFSSELGLSDTLFSKWKNKYFGKTAKQTNFLETLVIESLEDLQEVLFTMHNPQAKYELSADLDLSKLPNFYIPVLYGTFEGNGHRIKNLVIDNQEITNLGFFGEITGGQVKDLIIENANLKGKGNVGILAGKISNESIIENITLDGDIGDGVVIGGIAGIVENSILSNCASEIKVSFEIEDDDDDGYGWISRDTKLTDIGGLVGNCHKSVISNCQSNTMVMNNINSASIGGFMSSVSDSEITESYSTSVIKKGRSSAGFVNNLRFSNISNCYSKSLISNQDNHSGFVFKASDVDSITNSFSVCYVHTDRAPSKFIERYDRTNISNCFFEVDDRKLLAKKKNYYVDLKKKETYTENGWDFKDVWEIDKKINQGYPSLKGTKDRFTRTFYQTELGQINTNIGHEETKKLNTSLDSLLQKFIVNLGYDQVAKYNQVNALYHNPYLDRKKTKNVDLFQLRKDKELMIRQKRINEKNEKNNIQEKKIEESNPIDTYENINQINNVIPKKLYYFIAGGLIFVVLLYIALRLIL